MTKQEFLNQLEQLLQDLPTEDREDALCFYQEYFEDAGEEKEQAALADLGDVEELAEQIRSACQTAQPQTQQTQPYQPEQHRWPAPIQYLRPEAGSYQEQRKQTSQQTEPNNTARLNENNPPKHNSMASAIVIILIILFSMPIWLGILGTIGGIFIAGVAMFFVAILVGVIALFSIASIGMSGFLAFGICLIVAGFGLLMVAMISWIVAKVCAPIFKFVSRFIQNFRNAKND